MKRQKKKKNIKRIFLVIILMIIAVVAVVSIGWLLTPKKQLNVAVLDTTVPAADSGHAVQKERYYRKHAGFFWLLNQQKYVKSNGENYDYKKDYYGPHIDEDGQYTKVKSLSDFQEIPDMLYLADVYGSELYDNQYAGLTSQDMNTVALTHSNGGTVVGEMELFHDTKDTSVVNELKEMMGITLTTWRGRYVTDLTDMSDVPTWAPPDYEKQYGVEWKFSGPGIILVSEEEGIIVLEEKTDFKSKNLLSVFVNDEYEEEFGSSKKCNFYNWFELIEASNSTEAIASFSFNLNATGMSKFKKISSSAVFTAVTRKKHKNAGDVYYFAGDFNDCIQDEKKYQFLGADRLYKALSFDKEGDISRFYWAFYNPLMKKILKDTYKSMGDKTTKIKPESLHACIRDDNIQIKEGDTYNEFKMKAVNLNMDEPGKTGKSQNYGYYKQLLEQAVEMGINTIRLRETAPPEFYRALSDMNQKNTNKLYLIQTIKTVYADTDAEWKKQIDNAVEAVQGVGTLEIEGTEFKYRHDVSPYLLSYIVDVDITDEEFLRISQEGSTYSGKYVSSSDNEGSVFASRMDYLYQKYFTEQGEGILVGVHIDVSRMGGMFWTQKKQAVQCENIQTTEESKEYFYVSTELGLKDEIFSKHKNKFTGFTDAQGTFGYGSYVKYIKENINSHPLMIDSFGASANIGIYSDNDEYSNMTEIQQGEMVVRMLDSILTSGCIGGVISDLNDTWSGVSDEAFAYTVPVTNNVMWHNMADSAQTAGLLSVKAKEPENIGIEFKDFETMKKMTLSVNPEYFYITTVLEKAIDFKTFEVNIGIDTYQRNNGEYIYDKQFFANSLSGMEYVIRITDQKKAALYVCSSYDRHNPIVSSKESYKGKWIKVMDLSYGEFGSTTAQFFMAGTNVRIRIPWAALNVTDPSQKIVIEQKTPFDGNQYKVTSTDGFIVSMFMGNKETGDTEYIFPLSKEAAGYKNYKFETWETVDYTVERKGSFGIVQAYLKSYK